MQSISSTFEKELDSPTLQNDNVPTGCLCWTVSKASMKIAKTNAEVEPFLKSQNKAVILDMDFPWASLKAQNKYWAMLCTYSLLMSQTGNCRSISLECSIWSCRSSSMKSASTWAHLKNRSGYKLVRHMISIISALDYFGTYTMLEILAPRSHAP